MVAEQYAKRPLYGTMLSVVKSGLLGEPDCVNLSLAHEYHGARLLNLRTVRWHGMISIPSSTVHRFGKIM